MKKKVLFTALLLLSVGTNAVLHAQQNVDFEELTLDPESHWNGSDGSGMFTTGGWNFINVYDDVYGSWMGWSYTNETDNTTYDWQNMYSSASGEGLFGSENYATAYVMSDWMNNNEPIPCVVQRSDNQPVEMFGTWICLNANASLYMAYDDFYSNQNHYLKLIVNGHMSEVLPAMVTQEYILADYRFENDEYDFKYDNWHFISLMGLGSAYKLEFTLVSDDMGEYGLVTPGYFCIDNFNSEYFLSYLPDMFVETPEIITIDEGQSVDLTALAGGGIQPYTFEWQYNESLSSTSGQTVTASPAETTTYYVTVSDVMPNSPGHTVEKSITVVVNHVGIDSKQLNTVNVHPNPCSDVVTVSNVPAGSEVQIYDLQGRIVTSVIAQSSSVQIPVSQLAAGVYQVISIAGEVRSIHKLVIR
ncbi:MAG: DUF4465 domain-containing protein [Bacteroidales bacterium]|nr:DUF4465 domain-containing protein [Bacteroidales bacterium]HOY38059.1 DUF4465 domain-containing protein [Bacteroidales bacterium]HQP03224.1 DUF4465 domain-containing protein [Bacteroidales bacterium]